MSNSDYYGFENRVIERVAEAEPEYLRAIIARFVREASVEAVEDLGKLLGVKHNTPA